MGSITVGDLIEDHKISLALGIVGLATLASISFQVDQSLILFYFLGLIALMSIEARSADKKRQTDGRVYKKSYEEMTPRLSQQEASTLLKMVLTIDIDNCKTQTDFETILGAPLTNAMWMSLEMRQAERNQNKGKATSFFSFVLERSQPPIDSLIHGNDPKKKNGLLKQRAIYTATLEDLYRRRLNDPEAYELAQADLVEILTPTGSSS